ncbi:GspE/PulE family protein [Pseudomonas aeruginosa]
MARLDASTSNILTVEDPVEYVCRGSAGFRSTRASTWHFAVAPRVILRQDPDIIMIGEIRDLETAQIAVQASLTGHLVLATLHTNDAVSAVTRLVDMGVEPFLLASRRCLAYSPSAWCGACARIAGSKRTAAGARSVARPAARPVTAGAPASTICS